jgi:hypothetical protein
VESLIWPISTGEISMAMSPMNTSEIIQALTPLIEVFDRFGIAYYIGGSVASSVHGRRRYTQDVDVVAAIQLKHVQTLVAMLQQEYYIDADMIRSAIQNRSSFNLLHNDTGVKVDVFVQKTDPFSQQEMRRAKEDVLEVGSRPFFFASAEDMILAKLDWWKLGGGVSNRQWNDILEIVKEKQAALNIAYLRQSAPMLGVANFLEKAFNDAGLQTP